MIKSKHILSMLVVVGKRPLDVVFNNFTAVDVAQLLYISGKLLSETTLHKIRDQLLNLEWIGKFYIIMQDLILNQTTPRSCLNPMGICCMRWKLLEYRISPMSATHNKHSSK